MAKHVNWAVNGIVKLAKDANSESVRLAALRSIFSKMMAISEFAGSYANQAHLPREFLAQIVALYENTRLGRQEIHVEFLETTEWVWFAGFDPARHVTVDAEYHPGYFVRCAIDAGTSHHTAAVFFQVRSNPVCDRPRATVFGDYHALDVVSQKNAHAIKALADQLPCRGRIDQVRLDAAATARSSLGPAAYSEYERDSRCTAGWECPRSQSASGPCCGDSVTCEREFLTRGQADIMA